METRRLFAGIDLSAGGKRLTLALLSPRPEPPQFQVGLLADILERLSTEPEISVAVGGPLHRSDPLPAGESTEFGVSLRRTRLERARTAERDLARRGIPVRIAPATEGAAPGWMRAGFALGRELASRGFAEGAAADEAPRRLIEVHPTACFAALLGRLPLARDSLEGRLQRQLALLRERVALPDPMDALEEITAHHLLAGQVDLKGVCRPEELDALAAALTAWKAWKNPGQVAWLGAEKDGWLCLPAAEVPDSYRK
jgi:hypothetical protein